MADNFYRPHHRGPRLIDLDTEAMDEADEEWEYEDEDDGTWDDEYDEDDGDDGWFGSRGIVK